MTNSLVLGSVVEIAATPHDGFNTGFTICGLIMLIGGSIGMTLMRSEREAIRWGLVILDDVPSPVRTGR